MKTKITRFPALSLAIVAMLLSTLNAPFTTAQAQDKLQGDLSTPTSAAKTFFTAMKAGDTKRFRQITIGTDYQKDWMVDYMRSSLAVDQLVKASEARFGHDETDKAFGEMQRSAAMATVGLAALTNAEARIDGTNATITVKSTGEGTPDPLKLQQAGGDWKIILGQDINKSDFDKDAIEALADSQEQCAKDITADKYKSAAEASQAMMSALMTKWHNQQPTR